MTDRYKVSQAVMDELNEYKDGNYNYLSEQAVINYVFNGADNFEVKTPAWVIVSKKADEDGEWWALSIVDAFGIENWESNFTGRREGAIKKATRITDPELKDALLYANKGFEAIEVEK